MQFVLIIRCIFRVCGIAKVTNQNSFPIIEMVTSFLESLTLSSRLYEYKSTRENVFHLSRQKNILKAYNSNFILAMKYSVITTTITAHKNTP